MIYAAVISLIISFLTTSARSATTTTTRMLQRRRKLITNYLKCVIFVASFSFLFFFLELGHFSISNKPEIRKLTFCSFFGAHSIFSHFLSRRMHDRSMRPRSMQTRWKMFAIRSGCHLLVPIGIRWRFM